MSPLGVVNLLAVDLHQLTSRGAPSTNCFGGFAWCLVRAGDVAIKVSGDFTWDPDKPPTLTGLNLRITKGQLVAVVGPTGSGKTSLM